MAGYDNETDYSKKKQKEADMMKKILKISAILISLIVLFSGCKGMGEETKPNDKRFVSALGFDEENGEIIASVETVEAVGEGKVNPYILKNRGKNVASILAEIEAESSRELSFSHAEVVVLGEEVLKNNVKQILDFFVKDEKIPLSARVLSADNAEELLKFKKGDGNASGYEISDMIKKLGEKTGLGAHSTLYEIKTAAMQKVNIYALPILEADDNQLEFDGMRVYVDNEASAELDYDKSLVYTVIRNIFDGGEIYSDNGVYSVNSAVADIKADFSSDKLKIDISIKSTPESDELLRIIEENLKDTDRDYFGISAVIAERYPELWKEIESSYQRYFKDAEIYIQKG